MVKWRDQTDAINAMKPINTFILDQLFKKQPVRAADTLDMDLIIGSEKIAPFVRPFAEGVVVGKLGKETHTIKFPNIRIKKPLTAEDTDIERAAGKGVYIVGQDLSEARRQKMAIELQDLKDRITRTKVAMCWMALSGKILVDTKEIKFEVDFRIPTANKFGTLEAADRWSAATGSPLKTTRRAKKATNKASGFVANMCFMGSEATDAFLENEKINKKLDNRNTNLGALDLTSKDIEVEYFGEIGGMKYFGVSGTYLDHNGAEQPYVPAKEVRYVASGAEFHLEHCIIHDKIGIPPILAEFFAKEWDQEDPAVHWMLAASRPLPYPKRPGAIVTAQVIG